MVIVGDGAGQELQFPETPEIMGKEEACAQKISGYEQSREARIRENLERMEKLGILDLSLKLKSLKPTPNRASSHRKIHLGSSPLPRSGPVRRSSRLQNSTPVSYCEVQMSKNGKPLEEEDLLREVGSKPEVYTEEHEKLLGSTEMSWTLFVDGYGKDRKRIYDPVRGKTCHQCRQKTLGHRTHCSKCDMVQGQFCGDCLYMRYGENVLEANKNSDWICPVCRGICNCSLCRQAKGWPPTGTLYRKISSLGYKSVAHYLIQTHRANPNPDKNDSSKLLTSAKRSLPFADVDVMTEENDFSKSNCESMKTDYPLPETNAANDITDVKTMEKTYGETAIESEDPEKCGSANDKEKEAEIQVGSDDSAVDLKATTDAMKENAEQGKDPFYDESSNHGKSLSISEIPKRETDNDSKRKDCMILENRISVEPETSPETSKKLVCFEPAPDTIAGRLWQRRSQSEKVEANCSTRNVEDSPKATDSSARRLRQKHNVRDKIGSTNTTVDIEDASTIADGGDSIARRLKMRRRG